MATITGFTSSRMLEIENSTIVAGSILGDNLILITRDGTEINAGNVRGPQGIQGPIGEVSQEDLDAAIAAAHAAGAITNEQLATSAVTASKIAAGAVTSSKLGVAAVTSAALATNAVGSSHIQAGTVGTTHIANGAITHDKIGVGEVTNTRIGTNAVSNEKIGASAVDARTLASNAVTTAKILNNAVTEGKLGNDVLSQPWTNVPLNTGWTTPSSGYRRLRWKRIGVQTILLAGAVRRTGASGIYSCGNVPSENAPGQKIFGTVGSLEPGGAIDGTVKTFVIDEAGWITIYGAITNMEYGFCCILDSALEG